MQMFFEDPSEFQYDSSHESAGESAIETVVENTIANDWVQTAIVVPLLAVSVGAVMLMLPLSSAPVTDGTVTGIASASFGYDGHDHDMRLQRIALARLDGPRAYDRAAADH